MEGGGRMTKARRLMRGGWGGRQVGGAAWDLGWSKREVQERENQEAYLQYLKEVDAAQAKKDQALEDAAAAKNKATEEASSQATAQDVVGGVSAGAGLLGQAVMFKMMSKGHGAEGGAEGENTCQGGGGLGGQQGGAASFCAPKDNKDDPNDGADDNPGDGPDADGKIPTNDPAAADAAPPPPDPAAGAAGAGADAAGDAAGAAGEAAAAGGETVGEDLLAALPELLLLA
jgi:hypothetical protein